MNVISRRNAFIGTLCTLLIVSLIVAGVFLQRDEPACSGGVCEGTLMYQSVDPVGIHWGLSYTKGSVLFVSTPQLVYTGTGIVHMVKVRPVVGAGCAVRSLKFEGYQAHGAPYYPGSDETAWQQLVKQAGYTHWLPVDQVTKENPFTGNPVARVDSSGWFIADDLTVPSDCTVHLRGWNLWYAAEGKRWREFVPDPAVVSPLE